MRAILKSEDGHTLIELISAMGLMTIVMSTLFGALFAFNNFVTTGNASTQSRDEVRGIMESVAREVRSANSLAPGAGVAAETRVVSRGGEFDFIFKYREPTSPTGAGNFNIYNLQRIRYCLSNPNAAGVQSLYRETQTWTSLAAATLPADTACPSITGNYQASRVVATNIRNGASRPVFTYNSAALDNITTVRMQFYVDSDITKRPPETELSTGFFLRNVNRPPQALFTAVAQGNGHVLLNASSSTDADGDQLTYRWTDTNPSGVTTTLTDRSPVIDYSLGALSSPENHTFNLTVTDPGQLTGTTTQTLEVQ